MSSPEITFTIKEFLSYLSITVIPLFVGIIWWISKKLSNNDSRIEILENEYESQKRYINTDFSKIRDEILQMNVLTKENREELKKELRNLKDEVICYVKDSNITNVNEHNSFSTNMKEIALLIKEVQSAQNKSEIKLSEHLAFHKGKEDSSGK